MISYVVPTMWCYEPFLNFLEQLVKVPEIANVIIINNNVKDTPTHSVLEHEKLIICNCSENIYVNPAWNLGVKLSQTDKICIANDDIVVDLKLFPIADEFITAQMGLLGISPGRAEFGQHPITNGSIDILPWNREHTFGFGSLFFLHKNNWVDIPHELLVYYGDNWIFDIQVKLKRNPIYIITNCFFHSPWAQTTGKVKNDFLDRESQIYLKLLEQHKII